MHEWQERQPASDDRVSPPTSDEYHEMRQALIERNDPNIRLQ